MGGNTRDGSTPFSRTWKPPQIGGFCVSRDDVGSRDLDLVRPISEGRDSVRYQVIRSGPESFGQRLHVWWGFEAAHEVGGGEEWIAARDSLRRRHVYRY